MLHWLPRETNWRSRLKALRGGALGNGPGAASEAVALANTQMDFVETNALDNVVRGLFGAVMPEGLAGKPIRLALLSSCTMQHLHAAIRIAGLRRRLWIEIYENDYGQYLQDLLDSGSPLNAFRPTVVLFALDSHHLTAGISTSLDNEQGKAVVAEALDRIRECWRRARDSLRTPILHQTHLPTHPTLLGLNEHRLPGSPARLISLLNSELRTIADQEGVDLLAVDDRARQDGLGKWFDSGLWYRAKQEISPTAAPMYGDLVGRLLAAQQGRSSKCLVLDLDNTLWGGVIGDDGMDGIVLGQGSALGEAYTDLQLYIRELSRRGVILAVCSKNDETVALEVFDRHPEMILKRQDIASFYANWNDKAANIRAIAGDLNIGLDSLVFLDDYPAERALIRSQLPIVQTPEVSDDPIGMISALSDAGYFESIAFTNDDRMRTAQYQMNRAREELKASNTDIGSYLRSLEMKLIWRPFDNIDMQRIVQLINKTNQFNLRTQRYAEADILAFMGNSGAFGLELRLIDRFGDNGIIAIVIGERMSNNEIFIDTWLMSCRVLGREVERGTLFVVAEQAKALGGVTLIGEYLPTPKNSMVKDHYLKLGFAGGAIAADGSVRYQFDLDRIVAVPEFLRIEEG